MSKINARLNYGAIELAQIATSLSLDWGNQILSGSIHPGLHSDYSHLRTHTERGYQEYFGLNQEWFNEDELLQVLQSMKRQRRLPNVEACYMPVGQRISSIVIDIKKPSPERSEPSETSGITREFAPELSEEYLLSELTSTSSSDTSRRRAVLSAEVINFSQRHRDQLIESLQAYVSANRDSNDPLTLTAVTSAIRKMVSYIDAADLATLTEVLKPTPRSAFPIEIELEVTKSLVRRLSKTSPGGAQLFDLSERVCEIASTYLKPQLINREKHGAVALNATLAALLLGDTRSEELISQVVKLNTPWFLQQLRRRSERLLERVGSAGISESTRKRLSQLIDAIDTNLPD